MSIKKAPVKKAMALGLLATGVVGFGIANTLPVTATPFFNKDAKTALENRDLDGFKKAVKDDNNKKIDSLTQDEFNKMAEKNAQMQENLKKIEEAVKNNNFDAYKSVMESIKNERKNNGMDQDMKNKLFKNKRGEMTEEKQKEMFDKLVEYYKQNGSLPEKMGMMPHMGRGKMGGFIK
jgi:uncharacterized protein (DUF885 family)